MYCAAESLEKNMMAEAIAFVRSGRRDKAFKYLCQASFSSPLDDDDDDDVENE